MKKISSLLFIELFLLAACSSVVQTTPATATASPQPTALPAPLSPGDTIVWKNLNVTMDRLEVTEGYTTEYDSKRVPPAGWKFLWVHVRLQNMGQIEINIPPSENFSVLYAAVELKPTYGHRKGYTDYTTLGPVIFPDQELEAWLRFDIPTTAELRDLVFVFLPESVQVGVSPSSPSYPYASDKPTYVWKCEP